MSAHSAINQITTGASFGAFIDHEHARLAVQEAINKSPNRKIGGVLLFLTSGYALEPHETIRQAAITSGTLNVTGCCAQNIFSDRADSSEMEGAVAMVFSHNMALSPLVSPQQGGKIESLCLSLCSPNASAIAIESVSNCQFGAVTSDEFGEGPFSLWQGGRIVEREYHHNVFTNLKQYCFAKCDSVRPISPLMQINKSDRNGLIEIDQRPALDALIQYSQKTILDSGSTEALNILAMVSETSNPNSINSGHHQLLHVVSKDVKSKRLTLSEPVKAGRRLFWAVRDPAYAEQQLRRRLEGAKDEFQGEPKFALMFSNINRGADFYQSKVKECDVFKEVFPNTPMIGALSHQEIIAGYKSSASLNHSSTIFGLFA